MEPQRKISRRTYAHIKQPDSCHTPEDAEARRAEQRAAGASLLKQNMTLYALGKTSAADFAIQCHHCVLAGVHGAPFHLYGVPPGRQSGAYQQHLDKVIPPPSIQYTLIIPANVTRVERRAKFKCQVSLAYESIAAEIRKNPGILDKVKYDAMPPVYQQNKIVQDSIREGRRLPLPLALYTDGVAYTSAISGRADTVTGFSIVNVVTERRHLVCSLRSRLHCRCGCRGWCTVWQVLEYVAWLFDIIRHGVRPDTTHDGLDPGPDSVISKCKRKFGADLGYSGMLMWVRGDWMDAAKTHGLPNVSSNVQPCPFCCAESSTMYALIQDTGVKCALVHGEGRWGPLRVEWDGLHRRGGIFSA